MRRPALALASAAFSLVACSPAESILTKEHLADPGGVAGQTWVLRTVDGDAVPARVQESSDGYAVMLADTLRFDADSARKSGATRIVAYGTAVPHDSVYTQRFAIGYRVVDGQVRIGEPPCGEPRELILCAPADTGRVRGDTLALSMEAPGQPRRAYVRVATP